jgi:hypothetical protein
MNKPTTINPADLALFNKAQKAMDSANAVAQFTMDHIAQFYQLQQGDSFNPGTGEITRVKPDAAVPDEEDHNGKTVFEVVKDMNEQAN